MLGNDRGSTRLGWRHEERRPPGRAWIAKPGFFSVDLEPRARSKHWRTDVDVVQQGYRYGLVAAVADCVVHFHEGRSGTGDDFSFDVNASAVQLGASHCAANVHLDTEGRALSTPANVVRAREVVSAVLSAACSRRADVVGTTRCQQTAQEAVFPAAPRTGVDEVW
jgi:hypothetical protein